MKFNKSFRTDYFLGSTAFGQYPYQQIGSSHNYPLPLNSGLQSIQSLPSPNTMLGDVRLNMPGSNEVLVSHIENPSNFYVQLTASTAQLQWLTEQINSHYENLSSIELSNITPQTIVIGTLFVIFYLNK